jgi:hypothetical protein
MWRTTIFASLSNSSDLLIDHHFHLPEGGKYCGGNHTIDLILAKEFCPVVLMPPSA